MTDFNIEDYAQDFSFETYSEVGGDYSGLYIPEMRDCQMCGYCLNSCPTYKVRAEENYGPRGRVRMIERVIKKNEVLSDDELAALDACTQCRACETVCPSKMNYAGLYHQVMDAIEVGPKKGLTIEALLHVFAKGRPTHRALINVLRAYQRSGMRWLFQKLPSTSLTRDLKQLDALLPTPYAPKTIAPLTQAQAPVRQGEVALFTGCVANVLDTETHSATIEVLARLGYDVRVLDDQTCCGAMYAHNGDVERAKTLARTNIAAFAECGADAVVFNASGCGAFLSEYATFLDDNANADAPDDAPEQGPPIVDILSFLVEGERISELSFHELKKRVAVHEPCSQRNVLKTNEVIYELLAQIPGLDVIALADNAICCGAGGTKMVTQPELAAPLRDEKVTALIDSEADILVSTNLTCALHLARGVREAGRTIAVVHPLSLLAQQVI